MAKFRVVATHYFDLGLVVEADNEEEALEKAKAQQPSVRAEATYAPWEVMYENFDIGDELEVEEVDETQQR